MENSNNDHPNLQALISLWDIDKEVLNKILWVNHVKYDRSNDIGRANEYLEFMEEIVETTNPANAWEEWCLNNDIEHEISNNPYL